MPTRPQRLAGASQRVAQAYRKQRRADARSMVADAEAQTAREVSDLAMRAGAMALDSGASASRTTGLIRRLVRAYDLPMSIDVTYTRILLTYEPSTASDPITLMRLVRPGGVDYDRLTRVETLVERIQEGDVPLHIARNRLQHIADEPRQYRTWVLWAAAAMLGGAVAAGLGGNLLDVLAATVATLLVELVRSGLLARGVSTFFSHAVAAAMPTAMGLAVMATRDQVPLLQQMSPSLVVAAGMVSLLAGIGVVTAAGDALDGYYISAAARSVEVVVMTGAIVLGLVTTLWVGLRLGVPAYLAPGGGYAATVPVQLVSAGLVSASFGIGCNGGPRSLPPITALGVMIWAIYLLTDGVLDSLPGQSALAAMAVGFVGRLVTRPLRIPLVALVTTGVAPLMPGLALYRGVYAMAVQDNGLDGSSTQLLLRAALVALGLAAGSSFGANLAGLVLRLVRQRRRTATTLVVAAAAAAEAEEAEEQASATARSEAPPTGGGTTGSGGQAAPGAGLREDEPGPTREGPDFTAS